ncbi:MAG TPA: ACP S-malonyltransferase [Phycisphaerales bacterium]|nr:ACP S-malonyltransferase [Phycisphaerales bacterium]
MAASLNILCPGQGAQTPGMGKAWFDASPAARDVFERADRQLGSRLGAPLTVLCFEGPADRLNQTDVSQPAIYVTSIACWAGMLGLQGKTISDAAHDIRACAGLSLGEYTALTIAGAINFEDGLELVTLRGRAMQDAADSPAARAGGGGAMLALIGATDEQAEEVCRKARGGDVLVCANFNAPGQCVLSGHRVACERAAGEAETMGLRSTMLAVAGAFHSPLMEPAAARLGEALDKTPMRAPACTVVANVTARPYEGAGAAEIRGRLREQLTSPVRWAQSCRWMIDNASAECHELAPGKTLMGLMRRIDKSVKVTTHDEP